MVTMKVNALIGKFLEIKSITLTVILNLPILPKAISSCFNFENSIQENFFEHIFPSVEGHAKIIDKFLADPRAPFHETVKNREIAFFDSNDDNADWKVLKT
jgi:hypothetical protein